MDDEDSDAGWAQQELEERRRREDELLKAEIGLLAELKQIRAELETAFNRRLT